MMHGFKWIWIYLAVTLGLLGAGCASSHQPFVYEDSREEKPGPGLFSGEDGGFVFQREWPDSTDPSNDDTNRE